MVADLGPLHLDHTHVCQGLQQDTAIGAGCWQGHSPDQRSATPLNVLQKERHLQLGAHRYVCVCASCLNIPCTATQGMVPRSGHQADRMHAESQHASMNLEVLSRAGRCAGGAWSHLDEAEGHPREHRQPPPNSLHASKQRSAGVMLGTQ